MPRAALRAAAVLSAAVACPLVAGALPLAAGVEAPEYQLKAELIERFTRFIDWPPDALADAAAPFVIGVYGKSPFGPYLDQLAASRRIKGRPIKVVVAQGPADIEGCHVLFIPRAQAGSVARILGQVGRRAVLTIGDGDGFAETGVIINFFSEENRLRFEINDAAARRNGLRIGSQLLQLARLVPGEGH